VKKPTGELDRRRLAHKNRDRDAFLVVSMKLIRAGTDFSLLTFRNLQSALVVRGWLC
jgi:hypothetical protein